MNTYNAVKLAQHEAEKINKSNKFYKETLKILLPLHLSLQAFFGISRNEKGEWVKIGIREGKNENLKDINKQREEIKLRDSNKDLPPEFKTAFPNPDAFLLVKDAQWDFYAEIGSKIPEVLSSLKEFFDIEYNGKKIRDFEIFVTEKKRKIKGSSLETEIREFINGETLKSLCAVLANVDENKAINNYDREKIKKSKLVLNEYFNNKGKLIKPTYLKQADNHSKRSCDNTYSRLLNQLIKFGIKRAMDVIMKVDRLAGYLENVLIFQKRLHKL